MFRNQKISSFYFGLLESGWGCWAAGCVRREGGGQAASACRAGEGGRAPETYCRSMGVAALLMWPLGTGLLDTVGRVGTGFGPNRPFCFVGWVGSKDLVIEVTWVCPVDGVACTLAVERMSTRWADFYFFLSKVGNETFPYWGTFLANVASVPRINCSCSCLPSVGWRLDRSSFWCSAWVLHANEVACKTPAVAVAVWLPATHREAYGECFLMTKGTYPSKVRRWGLCRLWWSRHTLGTPACKAHVN
jgi:hypothetical protein